MTKEEYYKLSDRIEAEIDEYKEDQIHVNKAHKKVKAAITQLLRIKHIDSEQARALRQLYTIEDVLFQYTTDIYIG